MILAHCHFDVPLLPPRPVSYALPALCFLFAPVLFVLFLFRFRFSLFITHTLAHTQSHVLSHPLTHKRAYAPNLYAYFSCTLTHISLSFSLFPSLSLSLSLLHTYTDTHALTHPLIYELAYPLIHCCRVCALRCLQRAYARALSSLCFSPPSSLSCSFPFRFYLFCSLPPLSLACFLAVFLSLVRFLSFSTPGKHDFKLKQSNSHCKCILSLSCPWHFLSDGTVDEKNRGRDKLMRKDRHLLVPAAKFPYIS